MTALVIILGCAAMAALVGILIYVGMWELVDRLRQRGKERLGREFRYAWRRIHFLHGDRVAVRRQAHYHGLVPGTRWRTYCGISLDPVRDQVVLSRVPLMLAEYCRRCARVDPHPRGRSRVWVWESEAVDLMEEAGDGHDGDRMGE